MKSLLRIALLLTVAATPAWSASIGLYSDADCSSCNLSAPVFEWSTFYIMFTGASDTPPFHRVGLSAVEFRVTGLPAGWFATPVATLEAAFTLGNPMGSGANLAFYTAQRGECILLYTVSIGATSAESDVVLQVTQHAFPNNPSFACPNAIP